MPYIRGEGSWLEIKAGSMKLEKGNKATAWTPAFEDLEVDIAAAASAASTAQSTADSAASAASTAQSTADSAVTAADSAASAASTAQSTANTAKSTADSAASAASTAQSTADSAASAASTAQSTADTALTTAQKALSNTEVIVGTQTAVTGAWTGTATFSSLQDGQQIVYWLPYGGSGSATLELTYPDGSTTGAIPCYYSGATRLTTHYAAGNVIHLTYRQNANVSGTSYTGWWADANYGNTTNTYDRINYKPSVTAAGAIAAGRLGVFNSAGKLILLSTTPFDVTMPILYVGTAYSASALTQTNNYICLGAAFSLASTVSGFKGTAGATVYIKGTLNGKMFTPAAGVLTTTVPTSDDGYTYILLGLMSTTTAGVLAPEHPMFRFYNGAFKSISEITYEAYVAASTAQSTADSAASAASTAQSTADSAASAASSAQSAASTAQSTANSAASAASSAQTTADNAASAASTAQTTANAAQSTASTAKTTADNAKLLAEIAQADIDGLSVGGRNLIWRTLTLDANAGSRPAINGMDDGEMVTSAGELQIVDNGLRITNVAAVRTFIRFGNTSTSTGSMLGLTAGETYTFTFDIAFKLLSGTQNSTAYKTSATLYYYSPDNGVFIGGS